MRVRACFSFGLGCHMPACAEAKAELAALTTELSSLLKAVDAEVKGCFVKLSCRSAKDVAPSKVCS